MSWLKNSLLLAGGAVGLVAGMALMEELSDGEKEDDEKRIARLMEKIRKEAVSALEKCETEEQKEAVYDQVKERVHRMQAAIQQKGEEEIARLRESHPAKEQPAEEEVDAFETLKEEAARESYLLEKGLSASREESAEPDAADPQEDAESKAKKEEKGVLGTLQELDRAFDDLLSAIDPKMPSSE